MKNQAASVRRCTRLEKVARAAFTALVLGSVALASSSAPWSTLAAQGRTTQAGGAQPGTAQEDPESGAETEKPADTATESEPSVTPKPDGPVVLVETLGGLKTLDPASLRSAKVDTEEGTIQLGTSTFRIDELLFIGFGPTPAAAEPRSLAPARFRLRDPATCSGGRFSPGPVTRRTTRCGSPVPCSRQPGAMRRRAGPERCRCLSARSRLSRFAQRLGIFSSSRHSRRS